MLALQIPEANWNWALFAALGAFAIVSQCMAIPIEKAKIDLSASFFSLVLAMAFLGAAPAALMGAATMLGSFVWRRTSLDSLLHNVVAFTWAPLVGGTTFHLVRDATGVRADQTAFFVLIAGVFTVALAVNLAIVVGYECYLQRRSPARLVRELIVPQLPAELVAALLIVGVALAYARLGLGAIGLFTIVVVTGQYLMGRLLLSEERADELERRSNQLASLQVGLLSALLRTLDLRDRMTARHSAAVARYSREIAAAAGLSEEEQELVHTAGLLHDIGKFIFPDHILKADKRLSDQDWNMIRTHPFQGAKIVSQVEGYGPVGDIILAHHERVDGKGYPRGLAGEDIPLLSRIISVADVYDVITARDSYRVPVSSFEAIHELRRVAGTQLDPRFVDVFVELLAGKDVRYRHGEEADFDAELALEKRVHEYAEGVAGADEEEIRRADADGAGPSTPQEGEQASQGRATGARPS